MARLFSEPLGDPSEEVCGGGRGRGMGWQAASQPSQPRNAYVTPSAPLSKTTPRQLNVPPSPRQTSTTIRRDILRSPVSCSKMELADSLFPHAVLWDLRTIKCWGVGVARRQMSCRNELGCECMFKFCKTSAIRMPRRLPDTTIMLNCRSTSTWRSSNRIRCVGRRLKVPRISSA
jgi:hypothetical protein